MDNKKLKSIFIATIFGFGGFLLSLFIMKAGWIASLTSYATAALVIKGYSISLSKTWKPAVFDACIITIISLIWIVASFFLSIYVLTVLESTDLGILGIFNLSHISAFAIYVLSGELFKVISLDIYKYILFTVIGLISPISGLFRNIEK